MNTENLEWGAAGYMQATMPWYISISGCGLREAHVELKCTSDNITAHRLMQAT